MHSPQQHKGVPHTQHQQNGYYKKIISIDTTSPAQ